MRRWWMIQRLNTGIAVARKFSRTVMRHQPFEAVTIELTPILQIIRACHTQWSRRGDKLKARGAWRETELRGVLALVLSWKSHKSLHKMGRVASSVGPMSCHVRSWIEVYKTWQKIWPLSELALCEDTIRSKGGAKEIRRRNWTRDESQRIGQRES